MTQQIGQIIPLSLPPFLSLITSLPLFLLKLGVLAESYSDANQWVKGTPRGGEEPSLETPTERITTLQSNTCLALAALGSGHQRNVERAVWALELNRSWVSLPSTVKSNN